MVSAFFLRVKNMPSFSIDFIARIIGAILAAFGVGLLGQQMARLFGAPEDVYGVVFGLIGILIGLILTPAFTTRPVRRIRQWLINMPPERLAAIIVGVFLGLAAAALLTAPLKSLPVPFNQLSPLAAAIFFCYLAIIVMITRQHDLWAFIRDLRPLMSVRDGEEHREEEDGHVILLDTSVIIDGRITDISKTGFIRDVLLVPGYVLQELQNIADSPDPIRRNRGRRGLELLNILQKESPIPVRVTDMDVSEVREVDSKLVALARHLHCPIMTNDYNLNRVAELQGVTVLNINDLANAIKTIYLPGEELAVKIIQEGREIGQGVGYMDDGTMVVVEDGQTRLNQLVDVVVTKTLQTSAGRMIFARPC